MGTAESAATATGASDAAVGDTGRAAALVAAETVVHDEAAALARPQRRTSREPEVRNFGGTASGEDAGHAADDAVTTALEGGATAVTIATASCATAAASVAAGDMGLEERDREAELGVRGAALPLGLEAQQEDDAIEAREGDLLPLAPLLPDASDAAEWEARVCDPSSLDGSSGYSSSTLDCERDVCRDDPRDEDGADREREREAVPLEYSAGLECRDLLPRL